MKFWFKIVIVKILHLQIFNVPLSVVLKVIHLKNDSRLRQIVNSINSNDGYFTEYIIQYYSWKSGKFILFQQEIPSPEQWKKISQEVHARVGIDWQAPIFSKLKSTIQNSQNDEKPKATVLVSLYRAESFLDHFLYQLRSQTIISNLEVIFLASMPTEREIVLLRQFCKQFKNTRIIRYDNRVGIYRSWNDGIKVSNAPLITNMNVDDCRFPDSIEKQVNFMEKNLNCDVVYQDFFIYVFPNISVQAIQMLNVKSNLSQDMKTSLALGFNLPHHAPMWRRELHDCVGYFNESLVSAGDYDFWVRVNNSGAVFMKDEVVHTGYFLNPNGISSRVNSRGSIESKIVRAGIQ